MVLSVVLHIFVSTFFCSREMSLYQTHKVPTINGALYCLSALHFCLCNQLTRRREQAPTDLKPTTYNSSLTHTHNHSHNSTINNSYNNNMAAIKALVTK